jgi:hypothetical protein
LVATGKTQLYSGVFSAPILDEHGDEAPGANVPFWTGSTAAGAWSGSNCNDWSDPFASGATVGNLNGGATGTFLDSGTRACSLGARLVCVGVRQTLLPPTTPLSVYLGQVTVDEGATARNSGLAAPGATVSASIGTIAQTDDGYWNWAYPTSDGPDQSQQVTITATDGGGTQNVSFDLVVNNVAPNLVADNQFVAVNAGSTAHNTGTFGDPGDDVVMLAASVGAVADNGNGTWTWSFGTTAGIDDSQPVTITATDSDGAQTELNFDLSVLV